MKKLVSLILVMLLAFGAVAMAEQFPLVDEPITLTAFATMGPYTKGDFNDLAMWKVMEELTNVHFEFEAAPSGQSAEKLGLLFASNKLPDVIFKTGLSNSQIANYAAEGQLRPIDHLFEEYAPNYYAILEETPAIRAAVTQADGHIYGFNYLVTAAASTVQGKPFINVKYLESIGAEQPTTPDELYELLVAFKDSDWNGNGVADEIPFTSDALNNIMCNLYGTFGLGTRGSSHMNFDIDPESGELRHIKTSEGYKDLLTFLNQCYAEGLLDQEIFDSSIAAVQAKADQNLLFYCPTANSKYFTTYQEDFEGLEAPLMNDDYDSFWAGRNLSIASQNTFFTSSCDDEEIAIAVAYFDYFFSDEGNRLYFMGIEGETYYIDENGLAQFTEYVENNPDGMGMEEALGTYICWSGGNNPSPASDVYFGKFVGERTVRAASKMIPYQPEEIWGAFTYTTEESERIAELSTDIDTYIGNMTAAFISGTESLDNWDAYVAKVYDLGLEEYQKIQQAAYERYADSLE